MKITCWSNEIARVMGIEREWTGFETYDLILDDTEAELTTEHAASSFGLPVLVYKGIAYGPTDLPGVTLLVPSGISDEDSRAAKAAGWNIGENDDQ